MITKERIKKVEDLSPKDAGKIAGIIYITYHFFLVF